jgi:hypothetical protein
MGIERDFTKRGTTLIELDLAWKERWSDAIALRTSNRHSGAISAAIYALEIVLKVKVCQRLDLDHLPKAFEIHDLDGLLLICGLEKRIDNAANPLALKQNWDALREISRKLNVELRYSGGSQWSQENAVVTLEQINGTEGLIPWLLAQT